jgi:hypothetical protein
MSMVNGTNFTNLVSESDFGISEKSKFEIHNYADNFPKTYSFQLETEESGVLELDIDRISFPYEVFVFSENGKVVHAAMYSFQKQVKLDISNYNAGKYVVAINTANKTLYNYNLLLVDK